MSPAESRALLRARADALSKQADELRREADELFPLTEEERTRREIEEDDEALSHLLKRVLKTVSENPGISAESVTSSMGLPNDYPSEGSNYLTLQLLNHLESLGMVKSFRGTKPFEWTAVE